LPAHHALAFEVCSESTRQVARAIRTGEYVTHVAVAREPEMRTEPAPCPICETRADVSHPTYGDPVTVSCWSCGSFKISRSLTVTVKRMSLDGRRALLAEAKVDAAPGQVPELHGQTSQ